MRRDVNDDEANEETALKLDFIEDHKKYIDKMLKGVDFLKNNDALFSKMNKELNGAATVSLFEHTCELGIKVKQFRIKVASVKTKNPYICLVIHDDDEEFPEPFDYDKAFDQALDDL